MLAPDDRSILLDHLRPPVGHRLRQAIGTTFTLDLDAALAVPLAFASHRLSATTDPIAVMEAVRSVTDRVDVFCQAGQIRVPTTASDLYAFLEPMVHEVTPPNPGFLFHPKVWVLLYEPDDQPEHQAHHQSDHRTDEAGADDHHPIRLVCLTRNLTSDASWDAALRLDGHVMSAPSAHNRPIVDLLLALPSMTTGTTPFDRVRRTRIEGLADRVRHAEWDHPADVHELTFHALGLNGSRRSTLSFEGRDRVLVAPFCNDAGIAFLTRESTGRTVVVSEATDLDRLSPATIEAIEPHVLLAAADLDHTDESGDRTLRGGLHAKVNVVHRGRHAHVFIGSANATDAAYGGNVELVVELKAKAKRYGIEALLDQNDGMGSLIAPHPTEGGASPDPNEDALQDLKALVRRLATVPWALHANPHDGGWEIELRSGPHDLDDGPRLTASLLTRPGQALEVLAGTEAHGRFRVVDVADITPFLALHAEAEVGGETIRWSTVLRAELIGAPADRLDQVLARQIDTPEKLLRFLMLVLGLGDLGPVVIDSGPAGGVAGRFSFGSGSTGLFEALVRALVEQPQAFDDVERLIDRLRATDQGRRVLPDHFDDLWSTIVGARARLVASPVLGGRGSP